jgi:uncharacterized membrane protein
MTTINWIFVALLLLFIISIYSGIRTYSWVSKSSSYEGEVIELVRKKKSSGSKGNDTFAPKVRYVMDGTEREFTSPQSSSPPGFSVGEQVKIAYHAGKQKEAIATFGQLYGFSLIGSILSLGAILALMVFMNGSKILTALHPHLG